MDCTTGIFFRSSSMLLLSEETIRIPSLKYEPGTKLAAGCSANNFYGYLVIHTLTQVTFMLLRLTPTELFSVVYTKNYWRSFIKEYQHKFCSLNLLCYCLFLIFAVVRFIFLLSLLNLFYFHCKSNFILFCFSEFFFSSKTGAY